MAKENDYIVNKEVKVLTTSGDKVLVGHLRSRDGKVIYFNPIRGLGQSWIDSLDDSIDSQEMENKVEFA